MIKGLFFDLDGTLVHTYEADFMAYRDAIAEVTGDTIDQADFAKTHGQEMRDKLTSLKFDLSEHDVQKVGAAKKRHYDKYVHITEADESLIGLLAKLADQLVMVLVTTAKQENALKVLAQHGLTDYFQYTVFGDEVAKPKPDPEPYLLALQKSGLAADDVIAFEDSPTGIAAAEAAGIKVIPVGAGQ